MRVGSANRLYSHSTQQHTTPARIQAPSLANPTRPIAGLRGRPSAEALAAGRCPPAAASSTAQRSFLAERRVRVATGDGERPFRCKQATPSTLRPAGTGRHGCEGAHHDGAAGVVLRRISRAVAVRERVRPSPLHKTRTQSACSVGRASEHRRARVRARGQARTSLPWKNPAASLETAELQNSPVPPASLPFVLLDTAALLSFCTRTQHNNTHAERVSNTTATHTGASTSAPSRSVQPRHSAVVVRGRQGNSVGVVPSA